MLRSLHVIQASIRVVAYVRNLLVGGLFKFILSSLKVVFVKFQDLFIGKDIEVDIIICHLMLSELLGDLQNNFGLFPLLLIIWVDEHELVIMSDVEVLLNGLFALNEVRNLDGLFLDQELWVLVDQEWRQVAHLPLLLRDGVGLVKFKHKLLELLIVDFDSFLYSWVW